MQLIKVFSVISLIGLVACGGSGGGSGDDGDLPIAPAPVVPAPVDDISCDANYPLPIAMISSEASSADLPNLHDLDKTNGSNWLASSLSENLIIELNEPALLKQMVITWKDMDYSHNYSVYVSKDKDHWQLLDTVEQSEKQVVIPDLINLADSDQDAYTGLYLKLELSGNELGQPSELLEIETFGCQQDASHNVELLDWYLSVPTDENNNGKSDSIMETDLAAGYSDPRFFTVSGDGGLLFSTSVSGYRTSTNTKYVRSELREMLRRGNTSHKTQGVNKNNWVFSSAPQSDLNNAGGIDGQLDVELAMHKVTTTGEAYQIGRVVIGQIHANDDEPVRVYYRKLPGNSKGSVYIAHEIEGGDDIYFELIGSRDNDAENPVDGIGLGEKFAYSIVVEGTDLFVTVTKADGSEYQQTVDMSQSGYDVGGQYMYFKAGLYNLNNSGDQHDYVRATFYKIDNSHHGYLSQ